MDNLFYPSAAKSNFSHSLHAMRGIAAVIVFACHVLIALYTHVFQQAWINPFNGSGAVTFFYVLSGFVIAASIAKYPLTPNFYIQYGIKRFFRIMPLMFVTVSLGGAYLFFIDDKMLFPFIKESYGELTLAKFLSAYVGYSLKPNPPIWSVFVELVASAALPFMVLAGARKAYVFITGAVLLAFGMVNLGFHHHWNFYMIDFFIGVTILWWGPAFAQKMSALKPAVFWALIGGLFVLFYTPRVICDESFGNPWFNLAEIIPVALITASAYYLPLKFKLFSKPVFQFFGDISFSLYLIHCLILILVLNILPMIFPLLLDHAAVFALVAVSIIVPLSFYLARLSYRWIEQPGMAMGKVITGFYQKRMVRV